MLRSHDRHRCVRRGLLARELEHPHDVRVIRRRLHGCRLDRRSGDRRGDPCRERLIERVVQRLRELGQTVVVALEHRRHDLLVMSEQAAQCEDEKRETQHSEKERSDGERDGGI